MEKTTKERLVEEKIKRIKDFGKPLVLASLEVDPRSVAPAGLFVSNPDGIPPLVKVLPHELINREVKDALYYMGSNQGNSSPAEEVYSNELANAIRLAETDNYGTNILINGKSREELISKPGRLADYLESRRAIVEGREVPYFSLDMMVNFWMHNKDNVNQPDNFTPIRQAKQRGFRKIVIGGILAGTLALGGGAYVLNSNNGALAELIERITLPNVNKDLEGRVMINFGEWIKGAGTRCLNGAETRRFDIKDYQILGDNVWLVGNIEGYPNVLLNSKDKGQAWSLEFYEDGFEPFKIKFLDEKEGWIATPKYLLYTPNGGLTWSKRHIPNKRWSIAKFRAVDNRNIEILCNDDQRCCNSQRLKSKDKGVSWE